MNPADLVRDDLREFAGYGSARRTSATGSIWLNANESPWASAADAERASQRYPDPQPQALRERLADLYSAKPEQLLVGRGSDEAIDLLVRALCNPGCDAIVIAPPVFGMYAVSARLQNAPLVEIPLRDDGGEISSDLDAMAAAALASSAKLVFLCSPANPTGQALSLQDITTMALRLQGRAMVIVDEAYGEFSAQPSAVSLIEALPNVAVLRTLSKAHALAGARIGTLIADVRLIAVLRNCQAPYPLPAPCVRLALQALEPDVLTRTRAHVADIVAERERLYRALQISPAVRQVYPSQGNFLLLRFMDAEAALQDLLDLGIVVRDMRNQPQLGDALRVTIGSRDEN
ncbi:MAG: histidinol-phosphate transaminase, partial [Pseudomonadota bacterium]|nr:histidinol-phosphate transaminase [Pseudomonadota bacterium]